MWAYSFMQHALIAGIIIATICGMVSVLVVLRRSAFASHALGHMSLTGAAGALLIGLPIIAGQLILNLLAAMIMGILSDRIKKNDLIVGVVLTFILGLGAYFLFLFQNNYSGGVLSILFGNILAVSNMQLKVLASLAIIVLIIMLIFARPLIFASIDPTIAAAKNVPIAALAMVFFITLAITVSMACQIVGALLVFALLIIPGAIGIQWGDGIYKIIGISVVVANLAIIASLYCAYQFNLPVSFCITMLLCLLYCLGLIKNKIAL